MRGGHATNHGHPNGHGQAHATAEDRPGADHPANPDANGPADHHGGGLAAHGAPPATAPLWQACGRGLGTGKVSGIGEAAAGDGAYCDGCDNSITTGLVYDVVLTPYGSSKGRVAVLCEACLEDITSEMDVAQVPGGEFLVLVKPWFL